MEVDNAISACPIMDKVCTLNMTKREYEGSALVCTFKREYEKSPWGIHKETKSINRLYARDALRIT